MGCLITKDDPPNPNVKPKPDKKEDNTAPNDDNKVDDGVDVAIRKEIREMSEQELDRFWKAINKMCENSNGAGTSEYFRIASYHGEPRPIYCQHGRETFPGWHRIYLMEFELALKAADKALGNDGNIGLPYWDWTVNTNDGLPKTVRDNFSEWPEGLFPSNISAPSLTRATDRRIGRDINAWDVIREASDTLLNAQHWAHASTGNEGQTPYPSIETPHNSIHSIVGGNGGPMGSVAWAAFDVAFWLHHCNIDRIYEKYLELEPDSKDEMEQFQDTQRNDLFEQPYTPFKKSDGSDYFPHDAFGTKHLGYQYDNLPATPANELREAPTLCLFKNVEVNKFESKCYQIHVYCIDKNKEDEFKGPTSYETIDYDDVNYGGSAGIFGRGMECENCMTRPPMDIIIDITKTIRALNISRYNAKLKVYLFETTTTTDELINLEDSELPEPSIVGPLFEDTETNLDTDHKDDINSDEVKQLQKYLSRFGYYAGNIDGDYGDITKQAVTEYQKATGILDVDGIAGPKTKKFMSTTRRCANVDAFATNDVKDNETEGAQSIINERKETEVTYSVTLIPGYLNNNIVYQTISKAFKKWDDACALTFKRIDDNNANIKITFDKIDYEAGDVLRFDGPGGVLAHAGKGFLTFDIAERWAYDNDDTKTELTSDLGNKDNFYRGQPLISLYYTAMHEIGHCLGLDHSMDSNDIMSPFYNPKLRNLSENDKARIQRIYGE